MESYQGLTFRFRKANENIKTPVRMAKSDLILLIRNKEDMDWTVESNLNCMGEKPDTDMTKSWLSKEMPVNTSPPPG